MRVRWGINQAGWTRPAAKEAGAEKQQQQSSGRRAAGVNGAEMKMV